jgi:hypothetical protein
MPLIALPLSAFLSARAAKLRRPCRHLQGGVTSFVIGGIGIYQGANSFVIGGTGIYSLAIRCLGSY